MIWIAKLMSSRAFPVVLCVVALGVAGLSVYLKGRSDASHRIKIEQLQQANAGYEKQLALWRESYKEDQEAYAESQLQLLTLETKIEELTSYVDQDEAGDRECLDTDRLRNLWGP